MADGASTSARAEVWSDLLVRSFIEDRADPLEPTVLVGLRTEWNALVTSGRQLPWYAMAKLQHGADSTFLGLRLDRAARRYDATIVGDSCLFHLRGDEVVFSGLVKHPDDFGRFPQLISSRLDVKPPAPAKFPGYYQSGDVFVLATDAIARFLLEGHMAMEQVPSTAMWLSEDEDPREFDNKVAWLRRRGWIVNDDTTICLVRV